MTIACEIRDDADPVDLEAVDLGLDEYNLREAELRQVRPLNVLARGEAGVVIGGAVGRTWGGCCELLQLWVHERERGHGLGSRLMALFEQETGRRGCELVYLTTFSFQAPDFYARLGYHVVLETRGFTGGIVKFTMHKTLGLSHDRADPGAPPRSAPTR